MLTFKTDELTKEDISEVHKDISDLADLRADQATDNCDSANAEECDHADCDGYLQAIDAERLNKVCRVLANAEDSTNIQQVPDALRALITAGVLSDAGIHVDGFISGRAHVYTFNADADDMIGIYHTEDGRLAVVDGLDGRSSLSFDDVNSAVANFTLILSLRTQQADAARDIK